MGIEGNEADEKQKAKQMKLDNAKWVESYKKAHKVLGEKGCGPSDGIVCILATLNYIKAGLVADQAKNAKMTLQESFQELFKDCYEGKPQGFASNASAAMKAAKLESGLSLDMSDVKVD